MSVPTAVQTRSLAKIDLEATAVVPDDETETNGLPRGSRQYCREGLALAANAIIPTPGFVDRNRTIQGNLSDEVCNVAIGHHDIGGTW